MTRRSGHARAAPSAVGRRTRPMAPPVRPSTVCGAALKACTALQAEPVVAASFTMIAFSGVNAASRRHRFSGSSSWLPGTPDVVQVRKTVGKVGPEV